MVKDKISEEVEALGDNPKILKKALMEVKKENEEADKLLNEAHNELSRNVVGNIRPIFTVGGKEYVLVVPISKVRFDNKLQEVTAESLDKDKDLLAHLVKIKSGVLILEKDLNGV